VSSSRREKFDLVTVGRMRGHGCHDVLIYCESLWCRHSALMNVDALPDATAVRSLCARMVCTRCDQPHTNRKI